MTYIPEKIQEIVSLTNNSTTPLNDGNTYTGTAELNTYSSVAVQVTTDQDGTLYMDFSPDGTNWDTTLSFNYKAGEVNKPKWIVKFYRYYRTRFTNNSGTNQTSLRLHTYFSDQAGQLIAPVNGIVSDSDDATIVRPTKYEHEVAMGKRQGRSTWNKFGYNLNVDSASGFEIVASWGGTFDPTTDIITTAQTFTIAYNNANDGDGTAGATQLLFYYLDENWLLQTATHTLGSTGSDVTSFTGLGINRCAVIANGGTPYNVSEITITATTDGSTQAQIPAQSAVTQQCIFHTQINHTFLLDWIWFNIRRITAGGSDIQYTLVGYSYSRVTQTRYEVFRTDDSTRTNTSDEINSDHPFPIGGREVLYFVLDTGTDNTVINMRFSGVEERVS